MSTEGLPRPWFQQGIFLLLALFIPLLITYEIIDQLRTPAIDFAIDWQTGTIRRVPPQSSANTSGFMPGDKILEVDDIPYATWNYFSLGVSHLMILRQGQRLNLELPVFPLIRKNWPFLVSAVLIAITYWLSSIWLLLRRFQRQDIRILFVAGQAVGISLLAPMANLRQRIDQWPIHISVGALYLAAPLILHHYLTFPSAVGSQTQRRRWLAPLYALWLAAFACWLWGREWGRWIGTLYTVTILIAALIVMGYVYLHRATPADRRRMRLIVLGALLAGIPAIFFYLLPDLLQLPHRLPLWLVGPFTMIAPISYLYAILRHNLFNIDRVLNRTLVYLILSAGILALYIGPYLLIYRQLQGDPIIEIFVVILLTLFIGTSFDWTRRRVQRLVDKLFYGGWYDYPRVVEAISNALARCTERAQLNDVLVRQAPDLMQLRYGDLWIGGPVEQPSQADDPTKRSWDLTFQGERRGRWIVATRRDGDDFSQDDLRILKTIAVQAETALGNVLMIETLRQQLADIRQMQHQLLRSREAERARLARDLHDGPLQILVGANIQLGMLLATPTEVSQLPAGDGREQLQSLRTEIRNLLTELRQVCMALRPPMLDTLGLGAALRALAEEWSSQTGLDIHIDLPENIDLRELPVEVAVNLYRVAQESLSNVARHAQAHQAAIRLEQEQNHLEMSIQDDGIGFTLPHTANTLPATGHFGLAGMQERVELIGGNLMIESSPGQGTNIQVTWKNS